MPDEPTADRASASPSEALDPSTFRPRQRTATHERAKALHICPSCDSELVYPVDWAPADRTRWRVDLYCPECDWSGGGVFTQELVDAFDEELDRGTEQLLHDLHLLARANMEDQVERFVDALRANLIIPEDF
jgi:hypothetical protein